MRRSPNSAGSIAIAFVVVIACVVAFMGGLLSLFQGSTYGVFFDGGLLGRATAELSGISALASSAVLLGMFFTGTLIAQWFEELVRRGERRVRAAPKPGYGIFNGVARVMTDGGEGALVLEGERIERTAQVPPMSAAPSPVWETACVETATSPFRLLLDGGDEIEVSPGDPIVEGFDAERKSEPFEPFRLQRTVALRIKDGDRVWVTGFLSRSRREGIGAYRAIQTPNRVEARGSNRVVLSRDFPGERWRARARAHRVGAYFALVSLGGLHVLFFGAFDRLIIKGQSLANASVLLPHWSWGYVGVSIVVSAIVWSQRVQRAKARWGG